MKLKRILSTLLLLSLLFTLLVGCANASAEGTLPPMGSMHTNETTSGEEAVTTRAATTAPKRGIPADDFGTPGFVRIAYCVSTEQIQRALPAFQKLMESYQT